MRRLSLLLLTVLVVAGITVPYVVPPFLLSVAIAGLIIGLLAVAVDFMGGYAGHISFGSAGIFSAAAYGLGFAADRGSGVASALTLGLVAGLFVTVTSAMMIWRVRAAPFVMVTLAQGMVVYSLAQNWIDVTGGDVGLSGITRPSVVSEDWQFYYVTLGVVGLLTAAAWMITRTQFGLAMQALRDSEDRAISMGYNTGAIRFLAFCGHGLIATVAGLLFGLYAGFVTPSSSALVTSGQAIAAMLIGGMGTLVGPVLGGLLVAFLSQYVSIYISEWLVILGTVYIVVVILLPRGLVGTINRLLVRSGSPADTASPTRPDSDHTDPHPGDRPPVGRSSTASSGTTRDSGG